MSPHPICSRDRGLICNMATNEVPRGPISGYVTDNVKRLRAERRWSLAELSVEMTRVGRPILVTGLHRIEQGKRRVDVDDLTGIALAFNVSPIALLLPPVSMGLILLTEKEGAQALAVWKWAIGIAPLHPPGHYDGGYERLGFMRRSWPVDTPEYGGISTHPYLE